MEENKLSYEELSKLMDKISDAMKLSDKKQKAMDSKEEKLHKQTKVMLVEEGKQELENLKKEKEEFDEMTVNSLVYSKEQVLLIKEESEKQYQEKLLETMHKQKEIQTKLYSMKRRELSPEKLQQVEKSAQEADQKVKDDMKKFQTEHFKKMAK